MQDSQQNLNDLMSHAISTSPSFRIVSKLKFKNTLYSPGDDIILIQKLDSYKQLYGKIITIAQVSQLQFPALLVAWYFTKEDPIVSEQMFTHIGKKQLIFSQYEDWQYVEAVKGKITVVSEEQYTFMDVKEREIDRKFFCRSYIATNSPLFLNKMPKKVCQCLAYFNPEETLCTCVVCGIRFHAICSGSEELCLACYN